MATIAYMLLGSSVAMAPTLGSMSYFVAPPAIRNLHRTLSKAVANLSKEGIQCFKVISGNKVEKTPNTTTSRRSRGDSAFVLACGNETEIKQQEQVRGEEKRKRDVFDFFYYNTQEFSQFIFPISTVKLSIFGNGEIDIKLFWKNFGFFENKVTISGNSDIYRMPWIGEEGKEVPFASFLLKDRSKSFCKSTKVEIYDFRGLNANYGKRGTMTCEFGEVEDGHPKSITWTTFDFSIGR